MLFATLYVQTAFTVVGWLHVRKIYGNPVGERRYFFRPRQVKEQ